LTKQFVTDSPAAKHPANNSPLLWVNKRLSMPLMDQQKLFHLQPDACNQGVVMHKSTVVLIVAALAAVASLSALAAERDPGVNHRQHRQERRIEQGVRSGELTHQEAKGLRKEQRSIRREEHAAKADGKLTGAERKQLHRDLNQASKDIYREKHDADKRPGAQ
jgi:hypothetical protein